MRSKRDCGKPGAALAALMLVSTSCLAALPTPCKVSSTTLTVNKKITLTTSAFVKNNPDHCSILDAFQIVNDGGNPPNAMNKCGEVPGPAEDTIYEIDAKGFEIKPTFEISLASNAVRLRNARLDALHQTRAFRVSTSDAHLILDNVTIVNGKANDGGAILVEGAGDLTVLNSFMENNTANDNGGAVAHYGYGTLTISKTLIKSNVTLNGSGGGLLISGSENAYIYNSSIVDNFATDTGGGMSTENSAVDVIASRFDGNIADYGNGGGINSDSDLYMSCVRVHNNEASKGNGGGIYTSPSSDTTIRASFVASNRANPNPGNPDTGQGGGIHASGEFSMQQSSVASNKAAKNGGGFFIHEAAANDDVLLANLAIIDNTAEGDGGAVWITGNPTLVIDDSDALLGAKYSMQFLNNTIDGNSADDAQITFGDSGHELAEDIVFLNNIVTSRKGLPGCAGLVQRVLSKRVNDVDVEAHFNMQWPDASCGMKWDVAYGSKGLAEGWYFKQAFSETIVPNPGDTVACTLVKDRDQFMRAAPCRLGAARNGPPPSVPDPYWP